MALDLRPQPLDWYAIKQGDTYPACNFVSTDADTVLARVRLKVRLQGATSASLSLDSETSGITINSTAAGAWDYTIDSISAEQTTTLAPGYYDQELEVTDTNGVVSTDFEGIWEILPQITD